MGMEGEKPCTQPLQPFDTASTSKACQPGWAGGEEIQFGPARAKVAGPFVLPAPVWLLPPGGLLRALTDRSVVWVADMDRPASGQGAKPKPEGTEPSRAEPFPNGPSPDTGQAKPCGWVWGGAKNNNNTRTARQRKIRHAPGAN